MGADRSGHPSGTDRQILSRLLVGLAARRGARAWLIAALLGAASAAALPPIHAVPVLLFTMPALLALLSGQTRFRSALAVGFWFGFGHHVVGLYWITEAILIEAARFWWFVPLAVPSLSSALAVFIAVPCGLAWRMKAGAPRVLILAGSWVVFDLIRQYLGTGFPWNPWGSVWAIPGGVGDVMLQPLVLVGTPGLTLLTVLLACAPALGRRAMGLGALTLALWACFGLWRLSQPQPKSPHVEVVLIQGNVPQGEKWSRTAAIATFERYLSMTRTGLVQARERDATATPIVVWPETASPFLLDVDANARAAITAAAGGAPVLAGSVRFGADQRPRNSLMAITGAGPPAAVYDKWHLVPFGEFQPSWFPLPIQVVPGGGFAFGTGPATYHVPGIPPYGALICYEAIFPAQVVDEGDRPDWLVNVTNDAWFGNSTGPRQHLAAARMRAVEEGLPLMRAANTGISVGFDAYGRELGRLSTDISGILVLNLPGSVTLTPFAKFGLGIPLTCALILCFSALLAEHVAKSRPGLIRDRGR